MSYDSWAPYYDAIYSFKDYSQEAGRVLALPGETLLDVGCGTGNHLAHLQQRFACQGVDASSKMLERARQKLNLSFHHGDMSTFRLAERFDVVLCLFGTIGYAPNLQAAVDNLARHLAPGGTLLLEPFLSPDQFIDGHLSAQFVDEPELKIARMSKGRRLAGNRAALDFHFLVGTPDGFRRFEEVHELAMYTSQELLAACAAAGLEASWDAQGLMNRGLIEARRPTAGQELGRRD